jgi:glycosyltransferase involved in cell wall biosynthesis
MTRIALVHEWLSARAGSEKTFECMSAALPSADLYALSRDRSVRFEFDARPITTTFLDRRWLRDRRDVTLPLMPLAWRWAGSGQRYDLVVTSSHACAKGFRPGRRARHLCYVHSPMRYAWLPNVDERAKPSVARRLGLRAMARWDRRSVEWVDEFACNSEAVRDRIRRFYDRDASVIYPPVDTNFYAPVQHERDEYALVVSRLVSYKRVDVAIDACAAVGMPLIVAGSGPDYPRLVERARRGRCHVRFTRPTDIELRELYRHARVLLFPAEEDFGIIPVEAQACGTPVLAYAQGGARETVVPGVTGELLDAATPQRFAQFLEPLDGRTYDPLACRANALRFSQARFLEEFRAWVLDSEDVRA